MEGTAVSSYNKCVESGKRKAWKGHGEDEKRTFSMKGRGANINVYNDMWREEERE